MESETTEPQPPVKPQSSDDHLPNGLALAIPLLVAIAVSFLSPNFQMVSNVDDAAVGQVVRDAPVGADFLQEYVGGHLHGRTKLGQPSLYQPETYQTREHDELLLGFIWPEDQYYPMVYPPFYYAATSWLSTLGEELIGYLWTARLWLWLAGLAVSLSGFLLHRFYPPCRWMVSQGLFASILFIPLLHNFNLAQKGSFLLLILSGTFVLLHHKRGLAAGLVFGLIAFKPHLGLTIGIAMLLKRQWRFSSGALATVAVLVGGSYWQSPQLWHDYVDVVGGMGDYVRTHGYDPFDSHSLWGAIELSLGSFSPRLALTVTFLFGGVVVAFLARAVWKPTTTDTSTFARQFAAMIIAMPMLSPHFYSYDLTILLLAFGLIVCAFPQYKLSDENRSSDNYEAESESHEDRLDETAFPNASRTSPTMNRSVWRRSSKGKVLVYAMLAFYGLAGAFPKIAMMVNLQFSIPLMIGMLWLLGSDDE